MVFSIGISSQKDWLGAGAGYMSSFVHVRLGCDLTDGKDIEESVKGL